MSIQFYVTLRNSPVAVGNGIWRFEAFKHGYQYRTGAGGGIADKLTIDFYDRNPDNAYLEDYSGEFIVTVLRRDGWYEDNVHYDYEPVYTSSLNVGPRPFIFADGASYIWDCNLNQLIPVPLPFLKLISALIENISLTKAIVAAGETFNLLIKAVNDGAAGRCKLSIGDTVIDESDWGAKEEKTFTINYEMPYDDMPLSIKSEVLDNGGQWKMTDKVDYIIKAGFPLATLGVLTPPEGAKCGQTVKISFPVTNIGFKGDVGVRVKLPDFEQDMMERIAAGETITPEFTFEMPGTESYRISVSPICLGWKKSTIVGPETIISIKPINTLFHKENYIKVYGGYGEGNSFTGFVAGKNVKVTGLNTSPGTGGLLQYEGYILLGDLGIKETAEIEYEELSFFRVEATRGIAIVKTRTLVERDTTNYEYSAVPIPSMAVQGIKSLGNLMTRPGTTLRGSSLPRLPKPSEVLSTIEVSLPMFFPHISEMLEKK
jgi:hypothetical protein